MKFRKKPVVIEATQWFENGDRASVIDYARAPHERIATLGRGETYVQGNDERE